MSTPGSAGPAHAVVFDFNGVLVDDEHVHFELFRQVLDEHGITITEADYHDVYLGLDDRGCFEAAWKDHGRPEPERAFIDELIAEKARRYVVVAEGGLRYFPGAAECITRLAARFPLAICSGALRPEIEFSLRKLGVAEKIALIVSAEDTTACKPDPDGYIRALHGLRERFGPEIAAERCLVIEDSPAGIQAALGAGMTATGMATTHEFDVLRPIAEDVIDSLDAMTPEWVDQVVAARLKREGR